jgi:hypothetical protein
MFEIIGICRAGSLPGGEIIGITVTVTVTGGPGA